jgi:transcriptional regulator with XRE-family HTH domain
VHPQILTIAPSLSEEALMQQLAKAIGARIRIERKARNLSQDALALACSIDRSYMGRIERGEVNITIQKLYVIADVLACDPHALLPEVNKDAVASEPAEGVLYTERLGYLALNKPK